MTFYDDGNGNNDGAVEVIPTALEKAAECFAIAVNIKRVEDSLCISRQMGQTRAGFFKIDIDGSALQTQGALEQERSSGITTENGWSDRSGTYRKPQALKQSYELYEMALNCCIIYHLLQTLINDCGTLLHSFQNWTLKHMFREANGEVDTMARKGSNLSTSNSI
ncbi:hypothetical protein J1N35_016949 [Gossypium stocksii]|uniref:RNase H type-1 domain-containing protein n=1 Tax=Gossypium stocksii TaxID=47602 RepID=A0A9D4A3L0_9ROSI|nr:hypothetical protein J1N35_016949 [Gossypium stocksii]